LAPDSWLRRRSIGPVGRAPRVLIEGKPLGKVSFADRMKVESGAGLALEGVVRHTLVG
jgi:hypothetical protein